MKKLITAFIAVFGLSVCANAQNWGEALNAFGKMMQTVNESNKSDNYSSSYKKSVGNNSTNRSDYSYCKAVTMYKFSGNSKSNTAVSLYEKDGYYYISCLGKYYTVYNNPNYGGDGKTGPYRYYVEVYSSQASMSGKWYFNK